ETSPSPLPENPSENPSSTALTPAPERPHSIAVIPSRPAPELKDVQQFYDDIGQQLGKEGRTYEGCFLLEADPNIPLDQATNLFVATQAGIQPGDYILDAACGAGGPSIDIAQQYPTVRIEGINLSEAQVDIAQTLIREADLEERVQVRVGDYHHLPYGDEVFDVVMCLEASGFTYDRPKLLAEFFRVLRPGGTLYIKEWLHPERPLTPTEQVQVVESERDTLYTASKPSEYERDLRQVGFDQIKIRDLSRVLGSKEDWDTPICCGDIKAQRPGLTLRPSSYGTAIATHPMATTATDLTYRSLVTPNAKPISFVYALGTLGYDFGTEARRDSFKQLMPDVDVESIRFPANPYDARQMVRYLDENISEAQALIWTLNLEQTPLYALLPTGPFAREVYGCLHQLLTGHIAPLDDEDYVEHVSIPGFLTNYTVRLFSGQVVPVVEVCHLRGLYGWHVNELVNEAVAVIQAVNGAIDTVALQTALTSFLNRVYFDLRNLGKVSRDRALNFAVTNAFQAASTFADAIGQGMQLDSIGVEKSPFCRRNSDCWDVKLKFFDPENGDRARKVYRFTIDVSDIVPVTLGSVRSWSVSK
ncbi:MAG: PatA/PatG family cyanobactin maturation protease, partial [Symploca sp. SIO2B6]|nr:PatA/PatG family cyanobactin maturation protease [Symploca sp. SIO2B6]